MAAVGGGVLPWKEKAENVNGGEWWEMGHGRKWKTLSV